MRPFDLTFIPKATITLLLAMLTTATSWAHTEATSDEGVDISHAIIYNPYRFLYYFSGLNLYSDFTEDIQVYVNDNGWKQLTKDEDFTVHILGSDGNETFQVRDKGYYTLVVRGTGHYKGEASQSIHIGEKGSWRDHKASNFSQIDNTNRVVTITSEEELALMAHYFNTKEYSQVAYSGWTFRLARDLDLSDYTWTPIGSDQPGEETGFLGHFDGQGHTIKGVYFERFGSSAHHDYFYPQGLFAYVHNNSSIKNLTLTDSEIVSGYNKGVGGIAGYLNANTTVTNCHVKPSVNVVCLYGSGDEYGGYAYGGIAGYSSAKMSGCSSGAYVFKVMETSGCEAFGGVVGRCVFLSYGQLTDCIYYGEQVFADKQAGAVIGSLDNSGNKTVQGFYASTTLKGCNGTGPSKLTQVEAYDLNSILSVNYGGAMITQYDYDGIKVYPNAMVYDGVCYTLPKNITALEGAGTEDVPFLIKTTGELDKVASSVNNGTSFSGKHFLLCNDLTYDGQAGNYTAIGYWDGSNGSFFDGIFDGGNHSISGVHIRKSGSSEADNYQGIFGWTGENAVVKNLVVRNSTFDAHNTTGAIVGSNGGRIENCHVADGVSVNAVTGGTYYHGGIAGYNSGTGVVSGCSSTVSMRETGDGACGYLGGIIGYNEGGMDHCLALGCDIYGTTYQGALVGYNSSESLSQNYYSACYWSNAQGTYTRTDDIGCGGRGDVSEDMNTSDGAVAALRDGSDNTAAITLLAARAQYLADNGLADLSATPISISGRTLWKDGMWNTLCLPFKVADLTGTPLEGATVMTLGDASFADGTLTLNFKKATAIEAGRPYIVKWTKADGYTDDNAHNLYEPWFKDVVVSNEQNDVKTDVVAFKGLYKPLVIAKSGDKTKLYLDADNKLCFAEISFNINAFHAYFQLSAKLLNISIGDVNGDGDITATDVTTLVNHVLGNANDVFIIENADINGDGEITATDATALVNKVLNGSQSTFNVVVNTGDETITYGGGGSGPARAKGKLPQD